MGRKSTVAALPKELVEACNALIREGRTIDEILAALRELGADVSRSATARYVKGARESMEKYRLAQDAAKLWVEKFGAEPSGDVARLLPQMLQSLAYQTLRSMNASDDPAKTSDVMLMSRALRDMTDDRRAHIEVEKQMRAIRAELQRAAKDVEDVARQAGMSGETVDQIKTRILGVGAQKQ